MVTLNRSFILLFFFTTCLFSACDNGLAPPENEGRGSISGLLSYEGEWPSADSLRELRFVGMRFIPQDTADFLQLNRMVISDTLSRFVAADSFFISNVTTGVYVYNGVAENFGDGIIDWRPIELYLDDGGTFVVRDNQTTEVEIVVDLSQRPVFPPVIE